jgi:hypothetical protein
MIEIHEVSSDLFIRGLTNLKTLMRKAEEHARMHEGERPLLTARLVPAEAMPPSGHPSDVHLYTLAAQIHWAAEGARLAVSRLAGQSGVPMPSTEASFAELHRHVDLAITFIGQVPREELLSGLDRTIVIERRDGAIRSGGAQFLIAYAIPNFYYHVTAAYSILRSAGVALRMADFLGDWGETTARQIE